MAAPMTAGDRKHIGGVIFVCTKDGETDAHSVNDTDRDDIVKAEIGDYRGRIVFPEARGELGDSYADTWEEAAELLKEKIFDRTDKHRDDIKGLRTEYDDLPTYQHSMKKQGNAILNLTADGHVRARSLSDTTGDDTELICSYEKGRLSVRDPESVRDTEAQFADWASALEWLAVRFGEYEKNYHAAEEQKTAFGDLPNPA